MLVKHCAQITDSDGHDNEQKAAESDTKQQRSFTFGPIAHRKADGKEALNGDRTDENGGQLRTEKLQKYVRRENATQTSDERDRVVIEIEQVVQAAQKEMHAVTEIGQTQNEWQNELLPKQLRAENGDEDEQIGDHPCHTDRHLQAFVHSQLLLGQKSPESLCYVRHLRTDLPVLTDGGLGTDGERQID